ncbi:hypothetical protein LZK73_08945 [Neorhizobium galegae]|nr:hypothetical protein LZK73_08945 [Neorhizobium galegae]
MGKLDLRHGTNATGAGCVRIGRCRTVSVRGGGDDAGSRTFLTGPGTFPIGGGEPPEEDGFTLMDAEGNVLADAENNQLTISQLTISRFIGLED